jgi:ribosomal-protein-alanine N-acetyltransferase
MTLTRLRWWHIADLLPIEDDLFGLEQWSAAMFWNELANGHHYVVALDSTISRPPSSVDSDEVVGYAGLVLSPPAEAWINNMAVRRDQQRHGIGRRLLEELLDTAAAAGIRQTLLEVAADNAPAQAMYGRHGFEVVGVRRGYYQATGTDALVMRREDR